MYALLLTRTLTHCSLQNASVTFKQSKPDAKALSQNSIEISSKQVLSDNYRVEMKAKGDGFFIGDNFYSLRVRVLLLCAFPHCSLSCRSQDIKEGLTATFQVLASYDQAPWNAKAGLEYKDDNLDSKVEFDAATKGDVDLSFVYGLPEQRLLFGANLKASPMNQALQEHHFGLVHDLTSDSTFGIK